MPLQRTPFLRPWFPRTARRAALAIGLGASAGSMGCGPGDTPADAGMDAASLDDAPAIADDAFLPPDALSTPISLAVDDDEGSGASARLEVLTNPLRVRLLRGDGSVALESVMSGLELGTATNGDSRYHDVTVDAPRGVTWHALDLGIEAASETEGLVGDGAGETARITLSRVERGVLRMRVTTVANEEEVALVRARWAADDGSYQGLGERFYGADARGYVVPMQMSITSLTRESGLNEHHVPVPFVVSSASYGLFAETREAGAFDVGLADASEVRATFEGSTIDYVFFLAPTPREIVAAYTRHTGLPILPPRWSFAPQHWRNEWHSREELETDLRALVELHMPATAFWIDNPWLVSYVDEVFDETRFTDPPGMLAELRASGFRPLVWNVPYLDAPDDGVADNAAEELFVEAERDGHLVRTDTGATFLAPSALGVTGFRAAGGLIDLTREETVDFWEAHLTPLVRDLGVRAFKLDYGEDVVPEVAGSRPGLVFGDGTTERETHNVYAMRYHLPYRRVLDHQSDEGGFLLVRASCWGGQTVADVIWPGDIDASLARGDTTVVGGLPGAISAMISLAASGFPSFASDTGGYRHGPPDLETLMRWAEHTAFSPFLQLGGSGPHHNPWLYDPTTQIPDPTSSYRELARAHQELVPYFRMQALRASADGTPPVLHPALAFPDDRAGYADPDAYLLGDDLFVAAVTAPGATTRTLHLPPGRWVHWWSGTAYDGASDVTVDALVGQPPVFVRVGAVIPMLAHDLETLVEAPTPFGADRIDPSDRAFLRARVIPMGARTITTEEGVTIGVDHTSGLTITLAPVTTGPDLGLRDVRLAIDLANAMPAIAAVAGVRVGGSDVAASTRASVEAGCDGVCWAVEGTTLYVSSRLTGAVTIETR